METYELLRSLENLSLELRQYRERSGHFYGRADPALDNAVRAFIREVLAEVLPAGNPCTRCHGTGVEP